MPKSTTTFTVRIINMERLFTVYRGTSHDKAAEMAAVVGRAIAIGNGSADIQLLHNETPDVIWSVKDGLVFLALIGGVAGAAKMEVPANG